MGDDGTVLASAELWGRPTADAPPALIAGWEDADPFCAVVCTTDVGLAFCRACPLQVADRALRGRRAASARCPAGVRLLAFPAPAGSVDRAAVLRVHGPTPTAAASVADVVRVPSPRLRAAARRSGPTSASAICRAARRLRAPAGLDAWLIEHHVRSADQRRAAGQALAQVVETSRELQSLYRDAQRQRASAERSRQRIDRLARKALRAGDEERTRIAHEIHDTAAQSMVSALRYIEAARAARAKQEPGTEDPRLALGADRLRVAIGEVRAVLGRLVPPGLDELGLAAAIRSRLRSELAAGVDGHVAGEIPRLLPATEQALYGIASEAISNAVRHGGAASVIVELTVRRGRVILRVADDGRGFDATALEAVERPGLGLIGMSRQASWLGGTARIRTAPGRGTDVRISVPLARHLDAALRGEGSAPTIGHGEADPRPGARIVKGDP